MILFSSCVSQIEEDDWYEVYFESLCDKDNESFTIQEDIEKYERNEPFDFSKSDSLRFKYLSFKFIAECCLKFSGSANFYHDTLQLDYWNTEENYPCECICDYKMTYKIDQKRGQWNHLRVKFTQK